MTHAAGRPSTGRPSPWGLLVALPAQHKWALIAVLCFTSLVGLAVFTAIDKRLPVMSPWHDVLLVVILVVTCLPILVAVTVPFLSPSRRPHRSAIMGLGTYLLIGVLLLPGWPFLQRVTSEAIPLVFAWPPFFEAVFLCFLPGIPCSQI